MKGPQRYISECSVFNKIGGLARSVSNCAKPISPRSSGQNKTTVNHLKLKHVLVSFGTNFAIQDAVSSVQP
jgi:hypothetical protein